MIQRPYLDALFENMPGFIDVRSLHPDGKTRPHVHVAEAVDDVLDFMEQETSRRRNVYVGVATRASSDGRTKGDLMAVNALWVDMDFKSPGDEAEFHARLSKMDLAPSMRVASGGGEHVYWILDEPFVFEGPSDVERFEYTLKGLALHLGTDRSATDASRILRVPGTTNYPDAKKRASGRVSAECLLLDIGDQTHSFGAFSAFELRGREESSAQTEVSAPLPEVVRSYLKMDSLGLDRFMRSASGLRDTSASGVDYALAARLARHAPISREDAVKTLMASRARAGADMKRPDYYERTVAKAFQSIRKSAPEAEHGSTDWFREIMRTALETADPVRAQSIVGKSQDTPRFPSHLPAIVAHQGGWYGVTTFAGDYGAGKSMLALSEGLLASEDEWDVAYHNLEMANNVVVQRVQRFYGTSFSEISRRAQHFNIFRVQPGARLHHIITWTESVLTPATKKLLVVIDSINTLASFASYNGSRMSGSYFAELERIVLWAQEVRSRSEGLIGVILVSELNKDGDAKGGKINYASDCVLSLKDLSKERPDTVKFALTKSREAGRKDLGCFHRDWQRSRFIQEGDIGAFTDRIRDEEAREGTVIDGPEDWFNK